ALCERFPATARGGQPTARPRRRRGADRTRSLLRAPTRGIALARALERRHIGVARSRSSRRAPPLADLLAVGDRAVGALGNPDRLSPGARPLRGAQCDPGARAAPVGASTGGGWRRVVLRVRAPGP